MENGLPQLQITCEGATTVSLDELHDLQGKLKDLTEANYVKLRNSMLEYGFSFPVFIWTDENGTKYIIDAHQRYRTLKQMQGEGYIIPPLPADIIHAKNKTEAKKKLLLANSKYGKITREGFDEFIAEPGFEIGDDMEDLLVLPEITVYANAEQQEQTNPLQDLTNQQLKEVECPNCKTRFEV